ncbi:TPA: glycosyltransferase family 2 protein, partial [Streptococcus pneumoniae]
MKQILISIIIPLHNGEDTIIRAVKSVINSRLYGDLIEIIIVENGSTDQSFKISQKLATENSNIRVLKSDKGTSFARNVGIEKSKGKWLIFLDADDY